MIRARVVSRRRRVTASSSAPWPLMVPANTGSPGALSIGSDSPVIGAWLTSDRPARTSPSSGIFSPGRTMIAVPMATRSTGDQLLVIAVADPRLRRGQIHQRPNGFARPLHAARLEPLRDREQQDDRTRFRPLAEKRGADHGHDHQRVDVELEQPDRRPTPVWPEKPRRRPPRSQRGRCSRRRASRAAPGAVNPGPRDRRGEHEPSARPGRGRHDGLFVLEPRPHAGFRHRLDNGVG